MRVFSAVVVSALLGSCAPNPTLLDQILAMGELRVVTQNAPTTFYYGANDEPHGIEYELASAFADHLGVRLTLVTADHAWDMFPELTRNRAHIAAAGLAVTQPRRELVAFGPSYQTVRAQVIYRRGDGRPESLADLVGHSVEVRADSGHALTLRRALAAEPELGFSENRGASAESLMRRVAAGTIDYAVVNSNEFQLLRSYYPEIRAAFDLPDGNSLAWALPRHADELREEVGRFFASMQSSGALSRLLDRYYDSRRDFDFVGQRAFVRHLRDRFPRYQSAFMQAEKETGFDWRLLAAIAYQESHWDADAVSPTGVKGLMMLTASTADLVGIEDRSDPEQSILGGALYLQRVLDKFPERIPDEDRLLMAIAAYNVGFGHVEDARIITESSAGDKDSWEAVRDHLPLLADERWYPHLKRGYAQGSVPVQYVDNIRHYYELIRGLTRTEIFARLSEEDSNPAEPGPGASNPI